jgi:hypothetical protein
MDVYNKITKLKIELPDPPACGGVYYQTKSFGESLCYVSGVGPNISGKRIYAGKVGSDYTLDQGCEAAVSATLNMLSILQKNIGDLNRIKSFVKLLCYISSSNDFYMQPVVANAASQLLIDIFGEKAGKATRSAIGLNVLPDNIPFEMEALIELENN